MRDVAQAFHWFTVDRVVALTAVLSLLGMVIAVRAAILARRSAVAAEDQARAAEAQAVAARDQVTVGREQTALFLRQVEQAEELEIQRRAAELEALQPAVVVSVQQSRSDPTILVLVVENLGKTSARNVQITPSVRLVNGAGDEMNKWRVFSAPMPVMPAGQRFQYLFSAAGMADVGVPTSFSFTVEAEGTRGPLPAAVYEFDLDAIGDVWVGETSLSTLVSEIKRSNAGLRELRDAVRQLDPEYKAWSKRGFEESQESTPDAGFP